MARRRMSAREGPEEPIPVPPPPEPQPPAAPTRLARRLHAGDAVIIGLGSMIGAGIFAAVGPAARAAGPALLLGLALAAAVAWLNAGSIAQLAAVHPQSGGAYAYGRAQLGPFWGFLAGWAFVAGKLASCAAMALTFGSYAAPSLGRPLAAFAVLALIAVNLRGVQKTAALTRVLVAIVLAALAVVVAAALAGGQVNPARLAAIPDAARAAMPAGVLQAAGLLFFAFAGYARVATLGEEVVDPARTLPRAIAIALAITLAIYAVVLTTALLCLDAGLLAAAPAPLAAVVEAGRYAAAAPAVRAGAAVASLSVLLSLLAGVGRTAFAMAANRDLPVWLAAVHPVHKVPHRAELLIGVAVASIVALADVRSAIGFSSFCVLAYYAIAHASAFTLPPEQRRVARWRALVGLAGCAALALALPAGSAVTGALVLLAGALVYGARRAISA